MAAGVEDAAHAGGGVDRHAGEVLAAPVEAALEEIVEDHVAVGEVVEAGADGLADEFGDDLVVAVGDGLHDGLVQVVVELVHGAVAGLPGVFSGPVAGGEGQEKGEGEEMGGGEGMWHGSYSGRTNDEATNDESVAE